MAMMEDGEEIENVKLEEMSRASSMLGKIARQYEDRPRLVLIHTQDEVYNVVVPSPIHTSSARDLNIPHHELGLLASKHAHEHVCRRSKETDNCK